MVLVFFGGNYIYKGETQENNVIELKLMMVMMVMMLMMLTMILTNSFSLTSEILPPTSLAARSSWLDARLSPPFSPAQLHIVVIIICVHIILTTMVVSAGWTCIQHLHLVKFDKKDK